MAGKDVWYINYNDADRPDDGSAWTTLGGDQSYRVLRGGSWNIEAWGTRSALRNRVGPGVTSFSGGFRVVAVWAVR